MSNVNDSTPFIPVYKTTCFIHKTILKNDLESLKHMLSDGRRDCLNDLDYSGRTPFHVALQLANPKALYLMLYYPLLHPSKLFANLGWTNLLEFSDLRESTKSSKFSDLKNDHNLRSNSSPSDSSNTNSTNSNTNTKGHKSKNSDTSENNKTFQLSQLLLTQWEKNPHDYFNSCLSLDERNHVNGCGSREVESLYEEHYKFLTGEQHNLELAARNYTNKFLKLYGQHLKKNSKELLNTSRSESFCRDNNVSNNDTSVEKHQDTSLEKSSSGSEANLSSTTNESVTRQNSDTSHKDGDLTDKLSDKLTGETFEKLTRGLLPIEKVDLVSTFDKTSPLHLLFSNVYISTYRPNMLKCFRILTYYFNKSYEFHNVYNSLDYTLYFNAYSVNKCLQMYCDAKKKLNEYSKVQVKRENNKNDLENETKKTNLSKGTNSRSKDSNEDETQPTKRELDVENNTSTKKSKTNSTEYPGSKVANFPIMTLVADAVEMANKKDKRSSSLLNSSTNSTSSANSSISLNFGNTDYRYNLFDEFDMRSYSLHRLMASTSLWVDPNVSWETFVKKPDFSRSTILHRVCNLKDQSLIKLVLTCGFSPIVINESGDMPVHLSVDAKDPYAFLTIFHCTLKELFYSRFDPHNKYRKTIFMLEPDRLERPTTRFMKPVEIKEYSSSQYLNEFYNMFMGKMCVDFFKNNEVLSDKFYDCVQKPKFNNLVSKLDPDTRRIMFDEFLMLYEQLVYRCIKSSSWECLLALFSYNAALTYHLFSNPCFMHRFINFANMTNNTYEFMNTIEFTIVNVLFDNLTKTALTASAIVNKTATSSTSKAPSSNSSTSSKGSKVDSFKGCGIPHSGLRSISLSRGYRTVGNYSTPCFNEDAVMASFLRGYKRSNRYSDTNMKTWIITHPTCLHHLATPEPTDAPNKRHRLIITYPENPTRLEVIISNDNGILRSDTLENVKLIHSPPPASLADILRVHDWAYIDKLLEQVQVAQKRWVTHPYWPVLADGDTPVTPHSWSAALYAAGSVLSAVDAVCTNMCKNAFCAVRPPGHHLGTWGAAQNNNFEDEDFAAGSQGFCLINNVAIGAAYAKYMYANKGIRRIAIIDFDVHHGNGTEQVVRNIGPKNVKVKVTAPEGAYPSSVQSETIYKRWFGWRDENDRNEVLFASIHAYDGMFYPGTGQQCTLYQEENKPNIINVAVPQGTSSAEFRALFETKICPYVYHFKPDLIFISAGFDGHYRDSVSYGFTRYTEKDFNYVTERLVTIANSVCEGRVVSVLEGGYNTKLNTLSPFARSVLEHVTALVNTNQETTYPYMYGEPSISYLLLPVLKKINPENEEELLKLDNVSTPSRVNDKIDNMDQNVDKVEDKENKNKTEKKDNKLQEKDNKQDYSGNEKKNNKTDKTEKGDKEKELDNKNSRNKEEKHEKIEKQDHLTKKQQPIQSQQLLQTNTETSTSTVSTDEYTDSDYEGDYRLRNETAVRAFKVRVKTELLVSKVYSNYDKYCSHSRLTKYDKSQMCCRSVFEMYGNFYLTFYSKYFYSLFAPPTTTLNTQPFFLSGMDILSSSDSLYDFSEPVFSESGYSECCENNGSTSNLENRVNDKIDNMDQNLDKVEDKENKNKTEKRDNKLQEKDNKVNNLENKEKNNKDDNTNNCNYNNTNTEESVNNVSVQDMGVDVDVEFQTLNTDLNYRLDCTSSNSGDNNNKMDLDNKEKENLDKDHGNKEENKGKNDKDNENKESEEVNETKENNEYTEDTSFKQKQDERNLYKEDKYDIQSKNDAKMYLELRDSFVKMNESVLQNNDLTELDENIEEFIMKLKAMNDGTKSSNMYSKDTWLGNVKLRALEHNLLVATKLESFYSKFGYLFDKTCHIHQ